MYVLKYTSMEFNRSMTVVIMLDVSTRLESSSAVESGSKHLIQGQLPSVKPQANVVQNMNTITFNSAISAALAAFLTVPT